MTDLTATGKRRGFAGAYCARWTAGRASVFLGFLVALGSVATSGPASAQDFDGGWSGTFSCDDYKSYMAYSIPVRATIADNVLKLHVSYLSGGESLSGKISDGRIELIGQGHAGNAQWLTKLRGKFAGPSSFGAEGIQTQGNAQATSGRPCHLNLSRSEAGQAVWSAQPNLEITPSIAAQIKLSPRLTGSEVRSLVFGNTLTGEETGMARWSMYIAPSGVARISGALLSDSNGFSDAGQITVRDNRFCAKWQRIRNGKERCTTIVKYDNRYVGVDDEGAVLTSFVVRSGDPDSLLPSISQAVEAERQNAESAAVDKKREAAQERQKAAEDETEAVQEKHDADAALEKASQIRKAAAAAMKRAAEERRAAEQLANNLALVAPEAIGPLPKMESIEAWKRMKRFVPLQEWQFCATIYNSYQDLKAARVTRNQIKQNAIYEQRQEALINLLPNGEFEGWVVHAVEVTQAVNGSAAVILRLPCHVLIGSNPCDADPTSYQSTIPEASPFYREAEQLDATKDFVMVSGRLLQALDQLGRPLPSYSFLTPDHCKKLEDGNNEDDLFVVQLKSIFKSRF